MFYPMKVVRRTCSRVRSLFVAALRPPFREVESYARLIAETEGRSVDACWHEAELQLWAWRTESHRAEQLPRRATTEMRPA